MRNDYYRAKWSDKLRMFLRPPSQLEQVVKLRKHYYVPDFIPALTLYMDTFHDDIIREPKIIQNILDFHIPHIAAHKVDIINKTCSEENGFWPGDFTPVYDCIGEEFDLLKQFHIDLAVFLQNSANMIKYESVYEKMLNLNGYDGDFCNYVTGSYSLLDIMREHVKVFYSSQEYLAYKEKTELSEKIIISQQSELKSPSFNRI